MEDFGEYTPTDSVLLRRPPRPRDAQPLPGALPRRLDRAHRQARRRLRGVHPLRASTACSRTRGSSGAATPPRTGAAPTASARRCTRRVNTGLSGVAYQGSDIGGFHAITGSRTTDELNSRWLQLGRRQRRDAHAGQRLQPPRRPRPTARRCGAPTCCRSGAATRSCARSSTRTSRPRRAPTSAPGCRSCATWRCAFPDDARAAARPDASSCSAPTCWPRRWSSAARARARCYLPRGRWIDLWRVAAYDRAPGRLRLGARGSAAPAGASVTAAGAARRAAAAGQGGSAARRCCRPTPTRSPTIGRRKGLVHLRERRYRLHVLAFPRGISRADLGTGVRALSVERRGRWSLRLRATRKKHAFRLQASMATLRRPFRPCSVRLRGRRLRAARSGATTAARACCARTSRSGAARWSSGAAPPGTARVELARWTSSTTRRRRARRGARLARGQPAARRPAHQRRRSGEPALARGPPTTRATTTSSCRAPSRRRARTRPTRATLRELIPARGPRPRARRLGPLAAHLRPGPARARLLLPLLVPGGGRGRRERAVGGRRAARVQPRRRAPARRADDHAGDPPRAPVAAAAVHARRALVQGLPGRGPAHEQDRAWCPPTRPTPSGCWPTSSGWRWCSPRARRAAASSTGSATSCAASAAAASCAPPCAPACRSCPIAVVGAEDAMPIFAHVPFMQRLTGLIYFPVNHAFPHFGLAAGADVPAREVQDPLPRADRPVRVRARGSGGSGPRPVDRGGRPRPHPGRELDSLLLSRDSVWFG